MTRKLITTAAYIALAAATWFAIMGTVNGIIIGLTL